MSNDRKYPNGWYKYRKHIDKWESYVMDSLLTDMLKTFPSSKSMTQKDVARFLVGHEWIEEIQQLTYDSVKATGLKVGTLEEFKISLSKMKLSNGDTINAWGNSYERKMAQRITKGIKKKTNTLNHRIASMKDPERIGGVFKTIKKPSKVMKANMRKIEQGIASQKTIDSVRKYVTNDIVNNQYKEVVTHTMDKTANYQGKRLSQDQFMGANNTINKEKLRDFDEEVGNEELVMVGEWRVSPSHRWHMNNDPCEKFASIRYFEGSDIPVPGQEDTHYGCKCSCVMTVMTRVEADKLL